MDEVEELIKAAINIEIQFGTDYAFVIGALLVERAMDADYVETLKAFNNKSPTMAEVFRKYEQKVCDIYDVYTDHDDYAAAFEQRLDKLSGGDSGVRDATDS